MRVMWTRNLGSAGEIDLLFELFNVFNNDNFRTTTFQFSSPIYGLCGRDPNTTNCEHVRRGLPGGTDRNQVEVRRELIAIRQCQTARLDAGVFGPRHSCL